MGQAVGDMVLGAFAGRPAVRAGATVASIASNGWSYGAPVVRRKRTWFRRMRSEVLVAVRQPGDECVHVCVSEFAADGSPVQQEVYLTLGVRVRPDGQVEEGLTGGWRR
ncbi:hypothetical protein [Streptomyces sp. NPDC059455]|uniref:hypothetical protein n=1 Tax=Streptomyces sp. NPDC059455 TaxID=3346837 RepID=UPI0036A9AE15